MRGFVNVGAGLLLFLLATTGAVGNEVFSRGFNLVRYLSFPVRDPASPSGFRWPPFVPEAANVTSELLTVLKRSGVDFIRLPVDVSVFLAFEGERRDVLHKQLATSIVWLHQNGLKVIVDLHPTRPAAERYLDSPDGPNFKQYITFTRRVAGELSALQSGVVALELMNEPPLNCDEKDWVPFQDALIREVREVSLTLPLFVSGCWSSVRGLTRMKPLQDEHVYYSVHFYYPYLFTHQTATWTRPFMRLLTGLPYPSFVGSHDSTRRRTYERAMRLGYTDDAKRHRLLAEADRHMKRYFTDGVGRASMENSLQLADNWMREHGVPARRVVFTEIGAIRQLDGDAEYDKASRVRWFADITSLLGERGHGWAIWDLRSPVFGVFDHPSDIVPDSEVMRALKLDHPVLAR